MQTEDVETNHKPVDPAQQLVLLKAHIYDLMAKQQLLDQEMQETNEQIAKLMKDPSFSQAD